MRGASEPRWAEGSGHGAGRLAGAARWAVTLACLAVVRGGLAEVPVPVETAPVPGDLDSGGPTYDFRIGVFEITNEQFVAFLNDALANPDDPRGQYLYFATDTGNVYVHWAQAGQGLDVGGTFVLDLEENGRIVYSAGAYGLLDQAYADHPVTGVSWYGAVKFCNWMTIASGFSTAQCAYNERPSGNLAGWHPVTISQTDWELRDLSASERQALLALWGYRLPMDDQSSAASTYNEWYKAAAWDPDVPPGGGHHVYGFGRDDLSTSGLLEANYWSSGDPFDNGTTPVGYFDGVNADTLDSDNYYGLYDATGNVWEWTQDQGGDVTRRATRGGSWKSTVGSLPCTVRTTRTASTPADKTGFRIVQSTPEVLLVVPDTGFTAQGSYGGAYDPDQEDYLITNVSAGSVNYRVDCDADWLRFNAAELLTGQLAPDEELDVAVTFEVACTSAAVVGLNTATITVTDDDTQQAVAQREVELTLTEPLSVSPAAEQNASGLVGGPFDPPQIDYTTDNASASAMDWQVEADVTWVTFNGQASLTGTVDPAGQSVVTVEFVPSAPELQQAGQYNAGLTFTNSCTGERFTRSIVLEVSLPMTVTPPDDAEFDGSVGGPFEPESVDYTLTSRSDAPTQWEVTASPPVDWLDIDGAGGAGGTLDPYGAVVVTVEPNLNAGYLSPDTYTTTLTFSDLTNGYQETREVELTVTEFEVTPATGLVSQGPAGGPFTPVEQTYTITYDGELEMPWQASYTTGDGGTWLSLNGGSQAGGLISEQGGTAQVTVTINGTAASLAPGSYSATVTFEDTATLATVERTVDLLVGEGGFSLAMALVKGNGQDQPMGPSHSFRVGLFEVANAEFAAFLTSAADNLDNARGAFLYHDIDSGDVYLNASTSGLGQIGTNGSGTLIFRADDGGAISYDDLDQRYEVAGGLEDLPVVGVSWYGAVKFCNWMTLAQGMDASHQAYTEGPTSGDWQAVGTAGDLASTVPGFRLPMDDGAATASAYNEWYKAAAWLPDAGANAVYGFGRDTLGDEDANYELSGDPYETDSPPLTPTGFYDGLNLLDDGLTLTADTDNGYGLYDLCGNAAEWVHDPGVTRGGNASNPAGSVQLRADQRTTDQPEATRSTTGFRVAQSLLAAPMEVAFTSGSLTLTGVVGGPMDPPAQAVFMLSASADSSTEWEVTTDVTWLDVNGAWAGFGVLPPGSQQEVGIALNDAADDLLAAGEHWAVLTFRDHTTENNTFRWLSLTLTEALAVTPAGQGLVSTGPFRGAQPPATDPFEPMTVSYTLTNNSDKAMAWQVTADADWIDIDIDTNGTDPSGLESGEQVFVDLSINEPAEDLAPGVHEAVVSFTNTTTAHMQTRPAHLTVTDAILVTASATGQYDMDEHASLVGCLTGPDGGPTSESCQPFDFDADDDVDLADFGAWVTAPTVGFDLEDHALIADCLTGPGRGPLDEYCAAYDFDSDDDLDLADFAAFARSVGRYDFIFSGLRGGPFESGSAEYGYTARNLLEIPLDYQASVDVTWITLGGDLLTGTLGAWPDQVSFTATANANADSLGVGRYQGTITLAYQDNGVGSSETHAVWLYVYDLLEIAEAQDTEGTYTPAHQPPSDPQVTTGGSYTLSNLSDNQQVGWQVTCDQAWVTVNGGSQASGDLLPGAQTVVQIGFAEEAKLLTEGVYTATLTFTDLHTGFTTTRRVTLTVDETLSVLPQYGLDAFGTVGEPVAPDQQLYTLANLTDSPLNWRVIRADPPDTWLLVDSSPQTGGTLEVGGQIDVTVSIDQDAVAAAFTTSGFHQGDVLFINDTDGVTVARYAVTVTLTEAFDEQTVPGDDNQPGGPTYAFEMATHEVTNAEFVAFLNDAFNNPGNQRGYYMYHDTDSGDVYLNTSQTGEVGTNGSETLTVKLYSASANGDRTSFVGGQSPYQVAAGYERHPVTGVSWFGALKYCNWLTIEHGIGLGQRCYNEGPAGDLDEWRPVTIAKADWQTRDLDDTERQALVNDYRGFRLPMDDGSNNTDPWSDAADAYNEWYKAAAWDQTAGVNHVYGSGADDLATNGSDVNYWDSGDPFDNDTTPVQFFGTNGLRLWDDPDFGWPAEPPSSFQVIDAASYYGLYDLSGNVAEWMQDRYSGLNTRALRGGSWTSSAAQGVWIRTFDRDYATPTLTWQTIGFRVLRVANAPGE